MIKYEERDFRLAEKFCAIALGTDKFYRESQKGDGEEAFRVEGLVPVDVSGVAPLEINSWEEAIDALTEVYHCYETLCDPARRNYMLQQVGSFRKVCLWLSGVPMSFREIVAETMFLDENPVGDKAVEDRRAYIHKLLEEAGFTGSLEESFAAWHDSRKVNPEELQDVLNDLLAQGKERALAHGFDAIKDFDIVAEVVYGKPFSGYCDYLTRTIQITGELPYTYEELKHLVCHEAYPGHMTHLAIRQQLLEAGKIPADAGLVITNTASSPVFEGIADNGAKVLGWEETIDDEICHQFKQLQSICAVNASHILYCGGSKEDAAEYMRKYSFSSERHIQGRLRYMGFYFRKAYMYPYWRGWEVMESKWNSLDESQHDEFIKYIYENMHSNDTIMQFDEN